MAGFALGNALIGRAIDRWGFTRPGLVAAVVLGIGFLAGGRGALDGDLRAGPGAADRHRLGRHLRAADRRHLALVRQAPRGIAVATAASGNYFAGAIWPAIMPHFILSDGWRATYSGIGIVCLVTMLPLTLMLRRQRPRGDGRAGGGAGGPARPVMPTGMTPGLLQAILVVAGISCCVAMSMPQVHIVAYCMDLGYGVARGAEMLSLMLAAGVVSRLGSGWLADRIGGIPTLLIGSIGQGLSLLLLFAVRRAGLALCGVVRVRAVAGRHRALLRHHRSRDDARRGGRPAGRAGRHGDGGRHGARRLDVGAIYDLTGSYQMAFLNGIAFNLVNLTAIGFLLWRSRHATGRRALPQAG